MMIVMKQTATEQDVRAVIERIESAGARAHRSSGEEVTVIGIKDQYRGEAPKAFIKLKPDAKPFSLDELRAQLTGKVGKHELPAEVEFVEDLPRTPVGKLSRHELRQQQKPSQSNQPATQLASGGRS